MFLATPINTDTTQNSFPSESAVRNEFTDTRIDPGSDDAESGRPATDV